VVREEKAAGKQGRSSTLVGSRANGGSGLANQKPKRAVSTHGYKDATSDSEEDESAEDRSAHRNEFSEDPKSAENSDDSYQKNNNDARKVILHAESASKKPTTNKVPDAQVRYSS
jgi:hypothetical protein